MRDSIIHDGHGEFFLDMPLLDEEFDETDGLESYVSHYPELETISE